MKIGIVGNREGFSYEFVESYLRGFVGKGDIIVSGGAEGVDTYAQEYAKKYGHKIIICYPNPETSSPKRYFDRNLEIVKESDYIIAFDRGSFNGSGTQNTINQAKKLGKKVEIFRES